MTAAWTNGYLAGSSWAHCEAACSRNAARSLGDAAHLRAPNGEGANLAMQDGAELGRALAAHPGDVEAALTPYEHGMFARAAVVEADDDMYPLMIDNNAPYSTLAMMSGARTEAADAR